jgi:hypothetical protein
MGKSYLITLSAMLNHWPVTRFDFNENLDGTSFTKTKDWKPIAPEWNKYAWEQFGELSFTPSCNGTRFSTYTRPVIPGDNRQQPEDEDEDEDEEGSGSRKQRRKKDEYPMDLDNRGLPIIPAVDDLSLENKKSLIRTFLTKYYSKLHISAILQSNTTAQFSIRVLLPTAKGIGSLVSYQRHAR